MVFGNSLLIISLSFRAPVIKAHFSEQRSDFLSDKNLRALTILEINVPAWLKGLEAFQISSLLLCC